MIPTGNREERSDCDEARVRRQGGPKAGLSRRDAAEAVDAVLDSITDTLKSGGEVNFTGFGKFSTQHRKERQGVNPRNPSEKVTIPAATVPKFSAGSSLKTAVKTGGGWRRRVLDPELPKVCVRAARAALTRSPAELALASGRGGGRARSRDRALSRPPRRGGRAEALASFSSASTRGPTCCRSSCAGDAHLSRRGRGRRLRPLLLRDRRRGRAARRRGQAAARVLRGARLRRPARVRGRLRLRALGRAARARRRASAATSARPRARTRPPTSSRAASGPPLADAMTVNPYLGRDSLEPFLGACRRHGGGIFCIVKTSNEGGADVQDLKLSDGQPALAPRRPARRTSSARSSSASAGSRASAPSSARPTRARSARRGGCCRRRSCCCRASARRGRRPPTSPAPSRAGRRARSSTPRAASSTPSATARRTGARPRRPRPPGCARDVWAVSGW